MMVGATDLEKARMQIKRLQAEVEHLRGCNEELQGAVSLGTLARQQLQKEIEQLRQALRWTIKDCDAKTNYESIKRELLEALGEKE